MRLTKQEVEALRQKQEFYIDECEPLIDKLSADWLELNQELTLRKEAQHAANVLADGEGIELPFPDADEPIANIYRAIKAKQCHK